MSDRPARVVHETPPLEPVPLEGIDRVLRPSIAPVAPGHRPPGELRLLWIDHPEGFGIDGDDRADCPPLSVMALPGVELGSDWMAYVGEAAVVDERFMPSYAREYYLSGTIDVFGYPDVRRTRWWRGAAFVVSHFNMRTYGHFLLEVLPKCLLVAELHRRGLRRPIAFPASLSVFVDIVRAACPEVPLLTWDDRRERLGLELALFPPLALSPSAHLHEVAASAYRLLPLRLGGGGGGGPRRMFLSRAGVASFRTLANEAELAAIAVEHGFQVVRPETLPWAEQVRAFGGASHVVGEFSSALHNTVFSPPDTQVVCLNAWASVQSAIATTFGHRIGYLLPRDGRPTPFVGGWTETQPFEIDPTEFRRRLEQLGLAARPG